MKVREQFLSSCSCADGFEGVEKMLTIGDLNKRETRLPFFTTAGWLVLAFVGMISGMFGALMFVLLISQFLRP